MSNVTYVPQFVSTYSISIYLYGIITIDSLNQDYRIPIETYAAQNFSDSDILTALNNGWITQQEYDDTMSYKTT